MTTKKPKSQNSVNAKRNVSTLLPNGLTVLQGEELLIIDFLDRFKSDQCLTSLAITKKMAKTLLHVMEEFVDDSEQRGL